VDSTATAPAGSQVESLSLPPARPAGRVLGEGAAQAGELLRLLKEEAKVL
jgi:hypothetical protein